MRLGHLENQSLSCMQRDLKNLARNGPSCHENSFFFFLSLDRNLAKWLARLYDLSSWFSSSFAVLVMKIYPKMLSESVSFFLFLFLRTFAILRKESVRNARVGDQLYATINRHFPRKLNLEIKAVVFEENRRNPASRRRSFVTIAAGRGKQFSAVIIIQTRANNRRIGTNRWALTKTARRFTLKRFS